MKRTENLGISAGTRDLLRDIPWTANPDISQVNPVQDFQKIREAVRKNPDLPLTWDQAIDISGIKNPEIREKIIADFERIQATENGQQQLREIILKSDQKDRVKVIDVENGTGSAASYDSNRHIMSIQPRLYDQGREERGITSDQYIFHEMAHAASTKASFLRDAKSKTVEDDLFVRAGEEKKAEDALKKYRDEVGASGGEYTDVKALDIMIEGAKSGAWPESEVAKKLAVQVITQGTIDGFDREQIKERLQEKVKNIKEERGVDLSQEVDTYLRKPAPEYDGNDDIIDNTLKLREPGKSNMLPSAPITAPPPELSFDP